MPDTVYRLPKRPKPIQPWVNGIVAALYAAVSVAYFVDSRPGFGAFWAVLTLAWVGTVFYAVNTHRIRIHTWEMMVRTHERVRRASELRQRRLSLFLADDSTDAS